MTNLIITKPKHPVKSFYISIRPPTNLIFEDSKYSQDCSDP